MFRRSPPRRRRPVHDAEAERDQDHQAQRRRQPQPRRRRRALPPRAPRVPQSNAYPNADPDPPTPSRPTRRPRPRADDLADDAHHERGATGDRRPVPPAAPSPTPTIWGQENAARTPGDGRSCGPPVVAAAHRRRVGRGRRRPHLRLVRRASHAQACGGGRQAEARPHLRVRVRRDARRAPADRAPTRLPRSPRSATTRRTAARCATTTGCATAPPTPSSSPATPACACRWSSTSRR